MRNMYFIAKAYITIAIRLRYDYDTTTTKNWHVNFLLASSRVEWKQARAIRRSRIAVEFIVISITSVVVKCVVVSSYTTYRSLVVVESQLWYRLLYDYDPTTTYRARCFYSTRFDASKKLTCQSIFRRRHVVVVSQSNHNCNHGLRCQISTSRNLRKTWDVSYTEQPISV